jgi:septal ring factor EnvC (AmiA/AmiB activator)
LLALVTSEYTIGCTQYFLTQKDRISFEEEQLASINARLQTLEQTVATETANLEKLQADRDRLSEQINELQQELDEHREEVATLNEALGEATKVLDGHKRTALHSSKEVDKTLKEIAACVRIINIPLACLTLSDNLHFRRTITLRKPLLKGSLSIVDVSSKKSKSR